MKFQTIVTADILAENLDSPNWFILDCRAGVLNDQHSFKKFLDSHIPNAVYYCSYEDYRSVVDPIKKISTDIAVDTTEVIESLKQFGYNEDSQIIIYDEHSSALADSLWLLLRSIGCQYVAILQGGFAAWLEQDKPLAKGRD